MKKRKYILINCFLLALLGLSCITPYEPEGIDETEGILVVEGSITESANAFIKLSYSKKLTTEEDCIIVTTANVRIIKEDGTTIASTEYRDNGDKATAGYYVKSLFSFEANTKYALFIQIDNKEYQSEFLTPIQTPQIDNISWRQRKDGKGIDICLSTHDNQNAVKYYRWQYEENWEIVSELFANYQWVPSNGNIIELSQFTSNNTFYCWGQDVSKTFILGNTSKLSNNTIKDHVILMHTPENSRYSYLYSIAVKQEGLQKEAYDYFNNLKTNIEESGSIFAPQPTEMKGNIRCLTNQDEIVIGYINVATQTTHHLYIRGDEVPYEMKEKFNCSSIMQFTSPQEASGEGMAIYYYDYESRKYFYAPKRCVDCTARGGTKKKPSFWPNDHQ